MTARIGTIGRVLLGALATLLLAAFALFGLYYEPDPGPGAPRVLVAVDRTLWNGLGLNRLTYVRALRRAGLRTELVAFTDGGALPRARLDGVDGLVLTGGGDVAAARYGGDPAVTRNVKADRDAFETALLQWADDEDLPVLGLCRGAQLINVHRGGTLGDFRGGAAFRVHRNPFAGHAVDIAPATRLAQIYGGDRLAEVTTWHGQHVDTPGRGIVISAYGPDGIPEAIEVPGRRFVVGVQWHAEMPPWADAQQPLFDAFADAVRAAR